MAKIRVSTSSLENHSSKDDQTCSIVKLGEPTQKMNFFKHQSEVKSAYVQNCKSYGSSFQFGGRCLVQNMHSNEYYTHPHFFQLIETCTKLNEPHPSVTNKDIKEAKKLEERTILEINEVARRQRESEIYEKRYSARFKPNEGAACFSYSYMYRCTDEAIHR